jgi:hypothetical protein
VIHLELYVEEPSAKAALANLVPAIVGNDVSFVVHSFRGKAELLGNIEQRLRIGRRASGSFEMGYDSSWRSALVERS